MFGRVSRLEIRTFVPIQTQPFKAVDDALNRFLGGALGISVFDSQHQFTAVFFGKQPIANSGAGPTNMKIARGAGGKTNAYFSHFDFLLDILL